MELLYVHVTLHNKSIERVEFEQSLSLVSPQLESCTAVDCQKTAQTRSDAGKVDVTHDVWNVVPFRTCRQPTSSSVTLGLVSEKYSIHIMYSKRRLSWQALGTVQVS